MDITEKSKYYSIVFSTVAQTGITGGEQLEIKVPKSQPALRRVVEAMYTSWFQHADLKRVHHSGCIRADFEYSLFEETGGWLEQNCTCQPSKRPGNLHECDDCSAWTTCIRLVNGICDDCRTKSAVAEPTRLSTAGPEAPSREEQLRQEIAETNDPIQKREKLLQLLTMKGEKLSGKLVPAPKNVAWEAVKEHWWQLYRHECRFRKSGSKAERKKYNVANIAYGRQGWTDFCKWLETKTDASGLSYLDVYAQCTRTSNQSAEKRHPFGITVDAVEPFLVVGNEVTIHHPNNMVPTATFLNLLKWMYSPLLIGLVIRLCRTTDAKEWSELCRRIDHLYLIRSQVPYHQKDRLNMDPQSSLVEAIQRQSRAGFADESACKTSTQPDFWRFTFAKASTAATFDDQDTVERIISEIELREDFRFPRIDGVPYLYDMGSRPTTWTWGHVHAMYAHHMATMARRCNEAYTIVDESSGTRVVAGKVGRLLLHPI